MTNGRGVRWGWVTGLGALVCVACGAAPEGELLDVQSTEEAIIGVPVTTHREVVSLRNNDCVATLFAPNMAVTSSYCALNAATYDQAFVGSNPSNFVQYRVDAALVHPTRALGLMHLATPATGVATAPWGVVMPPAGTSCQSYGFWGQDRNTNAALIQKRISYVEITGATPTRLKASDVFGQLDINDRGAPLFCDSGLVGVFSNKPGGWFSGDTLLEFTRIDRGWADSNLDLAPPPVSGSLYMSNGFKMWRIDKTKGNSQFIDTDTQNVSSMVALNGSLYAIRGNQLVRFVPGTGAIVAVTGHVFGLNSNLAVLGNRLFLRDSYGGLYEITNPGTGARVALATAFNWNTATSMAALGSYLFLTKDDYLWRVDLNNGLVFRLSLPEWTGSVKLVAFGQLLYAAQGGKLWTVTDSGDRALFQGEDWSNTQAMTAFDGALWVLQNNRFHRVNPATGSYVIQTGQVFAATQSAVTGLL